MSANANHNFVIARFGPLDVYMPVDAAEKLARDLSNAISEATAWQVAHLPPEPAGHSCPICHCYPCSLEAAQEQYHRGEIDEHELHREREQHDALADRQEAEVVE